MKTSKRLAFFTAGLAFTLAAAPIHSENPCSGVDRKLTPERSRSLAPVVAKQLNVKRAQILNSFRFGRWSILYAATFESDEVYAFYSGAPQSNKYVTLWGGVAFKDEEEEIRNWTLKNAPGIPITLANCFAWHVTKERNSDLYRQH